MVSKRKYTKKPRKKKSSPQQTEASVSISQEHWNRNVKNELAQKEPDQKLKAPTITQDNKKIRPEKSKKRPPRRYNKIYKCEACPKTFQTPQALGGHRSRRVCEKQEVVVEMGPAFSFSLALWGERGARVFPLQGQARPPTY